MMWLTILNNETLLLVAETLFIIIGSMLLGILLSYFYWGGSRKEARELADTLTEEKKQSEELRGQLRELNDTRTTLQSEMLDLRLRNDQQSKVIFDHQQYIYSIESDHKFQKASTEALQAEVDSCKQRLTLLQAELERERKTEAKPKKQPAPAKVRANYEHISSLLGRQVTENDLTLIIGIGPKTASLLHSKGILTWEHLGDTPLRELRQILEEAGGIYKSHDPSPWNKQAKMAAKGEWRKLRLFQENLRNAE